MRIAVVANPASGPAKGKREEAVRSAFEGLASDVEVHAHGGDLAEAARRLAGTRPDVLVAAGGDGTVRCVASAVAGSVVPMAVLPMGTLNHFARDLGVPLALREAAEVAVAGTWRAIDAAEVNGHLFVNNSSIGVYARAVGERKQRPASGWLGKRAAMVRASGAVLRRLPAHHVRITIDSRPVVRTTSFVFVGNNSYGTGFGELGKREALDGGHLSVHHAKRPGRRAVLGLAARALAGRLDGAQDLQSDVASRVTIEMRRPVVRVALDGELLRLRPPLRYRILPGALRVAAPAPQSADGGCAAPAAARGIASTEAE